MNKSDYVKSENYLLSKALFKISNRNDEQALNAARQLIKKGANVNLVWNLGGDRNCCLYNACSESCEEMALLLLANNADYTSFVGDSGTCLGAAYFNELNEVVDKIINLSIANNKLSALVYLWDRVIERCSTEDGEGYDIEIDTELVKRLFAIPNFVNLKDNEGNAALHRDIVLEAPQAVELLIKHNANLNIQDADGNTPFHKIVKNVRFAGGYDTEFYLQESAKLLFNANADFSMKNNNGKNAFEYLRSEVQFADELEVVDIKETWEELFEDWANEKEFNAIKKAVGIEAER